MATGRVSGHSRGCYRLYEPQRCEWRSGTHHQSFHQYNPRTKHFSLSTICTFAVYNKKILFTSEKAESTNSCLHPHIPHFPSPLLPLQFVFKLCILLEGDVLGQASLSETPWQMPGVQVLLRDNDKRSCTACMLHCGWGLTEGPLHGTIQPPVSRSCQGVLMTTDVRD
jgi:hypothetical protein